ncbi:MAG TPA: SgcJ/EcaC family oxidoreductase [Pirellulales bacterium]|jgi:uncharacterized protein (TIGR02246 family)|nr:SgcJ/EcaC family oxidoreductase [Pirellulales bacterium]
MRSFFLFFIGAMLCVAGLLLAEPRAVPPSAKQPAQAAAKGAGTSPAARRDEDDRTARDAAVRDVVARLIKAYNGGDASAIASLFTADGEMIDEEGARVQGRQAIEQDYAAVFQSHPQAKLEVAIDSIRFLGPTLAIEEGVSTVTYEPGGKSESGRYQVTYVKQEGKWLTGVARELPDDETGAQTLEQLGWLVGSWVDESPEALVKTSYRWTDNHLFLVGEFDVHIAGRAAMSGTHRIGWDPLAKKIHSWVFDSEGGFGESLWTVTQTDPDSGAPRQWMVKMSGVTHEGAVGSATNLYTRLGDDRYSFQSHDRVIGGQRSEDTPEMIVAREAPEPGK